MSQKITVHCQRDSTQHKRTTQNSTRKGQKYTLEKKEVDVEVEQVEKQIDTTDVKDKEGE